MLTIRFPELTNINLLMAQLTHISSILKMGIVGIANVGKISKFNMLTKQSVPVQNFPF
ncbi:unnamed protein product [Paramecium pentaurelia]|uniref:G domain-containing protein n=1 Tax=Paramecium pentaurelia TaxID=43138 RepID=A0A8S1W9K7_9CILI|nr:unnamed protein product [Paramecium pentaurelia]